MSGALLGAALNHASTTYGKRASIMCDHGAEFMSRVLEDWACTRDVPFDLTRPGKPTDNRYIESFNGNLRDECLYVTQFRDLAHAQAVMAL